MGYIVEVRQAGGAFDGQIDWKGWCEGFRTDRDGNNVVLTLTGTVMSQQFADGDTSDGPRPTISLKLVGEDEDTCTCEDCLNEAIEASPCDTGECNCYMGPVYSVVVGDIEFEETRSPDPSVAWGMFLPILERNPSFADQGARLVEVDE